MRTPKAENPLDENIVRVPCLLQSSAREPESPSIRSSRLRLETRYGLFAIVDSSGCERSLDLGRIPDTNSLIQPQVVSLIP